MAFAAQPVSAAVTAHIVMVNADVVEVGRMRLGFSGRHMLTPAGQHHDAAAGGANAKLTSATPAKR